MNAEFVPYFVSINPNALKESIKPYIAKAAEEVGAKYIEYIKQAIQEVSDNPDHWKKELAEDVEHIRTRITQHCVEIFCGINYKADFTESNWMRAMVLKYGMGSKGLTGIPLTAGPEGRIVWDSDLAELTLSKVKNERTMPEAMNHAGDDYMENAYQMMRTVFDTIVEAALAKIPSSIFMQNIVVIRR